jgi:ectoine hydroxylase-related dioxygenase (phytanoyl-CoA dioxygenase family)
MNYLEQVKENGYCIISGEFNSKQINELLTSIKDIYEITKDEISQDTPYLNVNQPNVYNLQNKNISFINTLLGLEKIEKILINCLNDKWYKQIPQNQPNYILRSFGARSSNSALPLHIDSFIPYQGNEIIAIQVAIMLEDSTLENGCTLVVPGSHKTGMYAPQHFDNPLPLEAKAGDIIVWDSRLWHGTTENKTTGTRWAIVSTFCRYWLKQQFDITRSLPNYIKEQLTSKEKSILGFNSISPLNEYEGIEMKKGYDL